jgi:RNA polymerase sigma-70 factor (ECF subfamily)
VEDLPKLAPDAPPRYVQERLRRKAPLDIRFWMAPLERRQGVWENSCKQTVENPVMSNESARQLKFDQLATAYGADLYRFAMWLCGDDALAKDLVQETYLRAWKALDSLKNDAAAKGWLLTILRREYARTFERKVPKFTDVDLVVVPEDSELEPDDRAEIDMMRRNILKLEPKYREPLLMQVVMGYSCEEISAELGVSKSAVMTQLFRAREQLKSQLQRDGVTGNIHGLF